MKSTAGIVLIVAAAVLLIWGWQASQSVSSDFSRLFQGGPDNRTLWLVAGGIVAGVAGVSLVLASRRTAS